MEFSKEEIKLIRSIIANKIEEQIYCMTGSIEDFIQVFDQLKKEVDIYVKLCNGLSEEA